MFDADVCYICTHNEITYTNGAVVRTGFTTNLIPGIRICSIPDFRNSVQKAADEFKAKTAKELGKNKKAVRKIKKYAWPDHLISAAQAGRIVVRGVPLSIPASECKYIRKAGGGGIYSDQDYFLQSAQRQSAQRQSAQRQRKEYR